MSGAMIEVSTSTEVVARHLLQLADRLGDLHDPLAEFGELLQTSTFRRFSQAVAPDGTPWAPLAPSTLAQKKGPGPLRESLHLQGSIRYQVNGDAVEVGTDVPYAAAHQFGLPARTIRAKAGKALAWRSGKHPVAKVDHPGLEARPFLGVSSEDEAAMLDVLAEYLAGG